MVRLTSPLKGFALAGALLLGCLPGVAQAKWIKATVNGTVTGVTVATDGFSVSNPIQLEFIIQNYLGTLGTPNTWSQTGIKPNYTQLFGYGTGVNSTGLQGNYNSSSPPYLPSNILTSNDSGSNF
jgi:hypothetical protein